MAADAVEGNLHVHQSAHLAMDLIDKGARSRITEVEKKMGECVKSTRKA